MTDTHQESLLSSRFQDQIGIRCVGKTTPDVPSIVDAILAEAFALGASDAHLTPSVNGLLVSWRIDGVLHPVGSIPQPVSAPVVGRGKSDDAAEKTSTSSIQEDVLAHRLTSYQK